MAIRREELYSGSVAEQKVAPSERNLPEPFDRQSPSTGRNEAGAHTSPSVSVPGARKVAGRETGDVPAPHESGPSQRRLATGPAGREDSGPAAGDRDG